MNKNKDETKKESQNRTKNNIKKPRECDSDFEGIKDMRIRELWSIIKVHIPRRSLGMTIYSVV